MAFWDGGTLGSEAGFISLAFLWTPVANWLRLCHLPNHFLNLYFIASKGSHCI